MSNIRVTKLCDVQKGMDERIEESVFLQFGYIEGIENSRIDKWYTVDSLWEVIQ